MLLETQAHTGGIIAERDMCHVHRALRRGGQRWLPGGRAMGLRGGEERQFQAGTPVCAKAPGCETAGRGLDEEPRTQLV